MDDQKPSYANGKLCYIEIPALDIEKSSAFYKESFGRKLRTRGDGAIAFDDTMGQVSGTWVAGRVAATFTGILIYIMVGDINKTMDAVITNGGTNSAGSWYGCARNNCKIQ